MGTSCNCQPAHCSCLEQQSSGLINDAESDDPDIHLKALPLFRDKIDHAELEPNKLVKDSGMKLSDMTMDEYLAFTAQAKAKAFTRKEYRSIFQRPNLTEVTQLLNNAKSNDPESQLKAFSVFRQILPRLKEPTWQIILESKLLKRLVYFLDEDALPQLQFEALGVISKFVDLSKHITILVDHGVVPGLVDLLNSPIEITRKMAITTLANIAKESVELCEVIIRNVALELLLPKFSTTSNLQDASWVLRLFCSRKPQMKTDTVKQVLEVIEQNLYSSNEEVLVDTCWTLVSLCEGNTCSRQVVINHRVCSKLIELLDHRSPLIVELALKTVAKITTGDQMAIEHILDCGGILPCLLRILLPKYNNNMKNSVCKKISNFDDNMKKNVCKTACEIDYDMKKNACKTISSIANTGSSQIKEVVGYGFIYVLADMFEISDMDLKMEVAIAFSIVTSNGTNQVLRYVGEKCVKPLCDMLDCSDPALIARCLGGLICILKAWETNTEKVTVLLKRIKEVHGLKKIKNLVYDHDIMVSDMAKEIVGCFDCCIDTEILQW